MFEGALLAFLHRIAFLLVIDPEDIPWQERGWSGRVSMSTAARKKHNPGV